MSTLLNLSGRKFGKLTVTDVFSRREKDRKIQWECICDCGNKKNVVSNYLMSGKTKSCGCLSIELSTDRVKTHGLTNTRLYSIWSDMKTRCFNTKGRYYINYGGRGVTMSEEWKNDFLAFYRWSIKNGYSDELSIDRINNDGNYCPSNCRWVTRKTQSNNRRSNIVFQGKTLSEWCEDLKLNYHTVRTRIKVFGWDIEKALSIPTMESAWSNKKTINYKGKTLYMVAKENNFSYESAFVKVKKGMPVDDVVDYYLNKQLTI
jgi:hypothetical protein